MDWRKLELEGWRASLMTVQQQCERHAAKWWFHLYNMIDDRELLASIESGVGGEINGLL